MANRELTATEFRDSVIKVLKSLVEQWQETAQVESRRGAADQQKVMRLNWGVEQCLTLIRLVSSLETSIPVPDSDPEPAPKKRGRKA